MIGRLGVLGLALAFAAGCEGAVGPAGPAGPQGPPGPVGAGLTYFTAQGVAGPSGTAVISLPGAVDPNHLPVVSCYTSNTGQTWLLISSRPASAGASYCGLTGIGTANPSVTIIDLIPGWSWYVAVAY